MSDRSDGAALTLANGSLTIMENICQHRYVHCVPREQGCAEGRINLTFRCKAAGELTEGEQRHADSRAPRPLAALHTPQPETETETGAEGQGETTSGALGGLGSTEGTAALLATAHAATVLGMSLTRSLTPRDCRTALLAAPLAASVGVALAAPCAALWRCCWQPSVSGHPAATTPMAEGAASGGGGQSSRPRPVFLVACQMGIEDIVAEEIQERLQASGEASADETVWCTPWDARGFVAVAAEGEAVRQILLDLRTANHVYDYHGTFLIPPGTLDAEGKTEKGAVRIYNEMCRLLKSGELAVPALAAGASSFRASCERSGKHDFSSQEVEYEAGGALQEFYGTKARMKKFAVHVRVDVVGALRPHRPNLGG